MFFISFLCNLTLKLNHEVSFRKNFKCSRVLATCVIFLLYVNGLMKIFEVFLNHNIHLCYLSCYLNFFGIRMYINLRYDNSSLYLNLKFKLSVLMAINANDIQVLLCITCLFLEVFNFGKFFTPSIKKCLYIYIYI